MAPRSSQCFCLYFCFFFFFSSRRRHTRCLSDWSSDVCSSDLLVLEQLELLETAMHKLLEHEADTLPVVSRDDPSRVVGYVERSAILAAWVQLTRDEHTREEGWLGRLRRPS